MSRKDKLFAKLATDYTEAAAKIARLTARAEKAEAALSESQAREAMLHRAITEASEPDFIWGAMDNVNDMDADLDDFAKAASRAIRAAVPTPADAQDALASRINAAKEEGRESGMQESSKWLGELLAIIHRDGGHYQAQHGDEKAVADAHVILARMFSQPEAETVLLEVIEWAHRQPGNYPNWFDRARKAVGQFDGDAGQSEAERDAIAAAAFKAAARVCWSEVKRREDQLSGPVHGEIQTARWQAGKMEADLLATKIEALTPADAKAALYRMLREAKAEGMRQAAEYLKHHLTTEEDVALANIWIENILEGADAILAPADAKAALDSRITAAKEEGRIAGLREAADTAEDYCSDMPDLAGHGHSMGLKDAILAKIKEAE